MTRKAFTLRIDEETHGALANLSRILRRPMNQLVQEALASYLDRRSRAAESELEAQLASLRAYRRRDPDFEDAIAAFAEAEARLDDPLEGELVDTAGPVQDEIRRLLNARVG